MNRGMRIVLWLAVSIAIWAIPPILSEIFTGRSNSAALVSTISAVLFFFYMCAREFKNPDSKYYGQAEHELNNGTFDKGLWTETLVKTKGNEDLRNVEYIKLRAKQLQKMNK